MDDDFDRVLRGTDALLDLRMRVVRLEGRLEQARWRAMVADLLLLALILVFAWAAG